MTMGGMKHGSFPWRWFMLFVVVIPTVFTISAMSVGIHFGWIQ